MKLTIILSSLLLGLSTGENVVEVAVGSPNLFSALVDLVLTTELDGALSTTQSITVFAPTDDAFGKLHQSSIEILKSEQWRPHLKNLLLQHVLPVKVLSTDISDGLTAEALNGEQVKLNLPSSGGVLINDKSNVIQADIPADNGVIHAVDTVLFPEWVSNSIVDRAVSDPELAILTNLVVELHLTNALSVQGPFTVFAPTDKAFVEGLNVLGVQDGMVTVHLASSLLTYHIVRGVFSAADIEDGLELTTIQGEKLIFSFNGDAAQVNGKNIVDADILTNNGIVHKIDGLLIPQSVERDSVALADPQTVVDVASSMSETFSTLVDFVIKADLVSPLNNTQGITVFAPTNDAFAALDEDVVANLETKAWSTHLQDVLLYHVLPDEVPSSAVTDGLTAKALNGEFLSFGVNGDGISVNDGSEVVVPDVGANNGVIHAIDNVLIPSWVSTSIVDRAIGNEDLSTLVDLVGKAGLDTTLSGDGPFTVFAPTNDAFVKLLGENVDTGALDEDLVTSILMYHVVSGIYSAADVANGVSLTTVQGDDISFSVMGDAKMVNGNTIVATDILANNGIVHVIDGVLIPNEATASKAMLESLPDSFEVSTLGLIGSEQSSTPGCRTSIAAVTTAVVAFGVAIGVVF